MYNKNIFNYIRTDLLPHIWCSGCAHGIVTASIIRAIDRLNLDKNKIMLVSGIGCSGRTPTYLDFNTLHTTHGRSLTFSTGLKMANPELITINVMGDGDAVAIGGNHFIHSCRRNIDITAIVYNNSIYGMTGGQFSPTTPYKSKATTTPYGNIDPSFDIVNLALGAGATFVARGDAFHVNHLDKMLEKAIAHKGFSVVDVLTTCPTQYGRRNKMKEPYKNLDFIAEKTVSIAKYNELTEQEKVDKIPVGIFRQEIKPEYVEAYQEQIINKIKKGD